MNKRIFFIHSEERVFNLAGLNFFRSEVQMISGRSIISIMWRNCILLVMVTTSVFHLSHMQPVTAENCEGEF